MLTTVKTQSKKNLKCQTFENCRCKNIGQQPFPWNTCWMLHSTSWGS